MTRYTLFGSEAPFHEALRVMEAYPERQHVIMVGEQEADFIAEELRKLGIECTVLQSPRDYDVHHNTIQKFIDGKIRVLVSAIGISLATGWRAPPKSMIHVTYPLQDNVSRQLEGRIFRPRFNPAITTVIPTEGDAG